MNTPEKQAQIEKLVAAGISPEFAPRLITLIEEIVGVGNYDQLTDDQRREVNQRIDTFMQIVPKVKQGTRR